MNRRILYSFFFVALLFSLVAFVEENPYFNISKSDVAFKNPKGFPKPFYDFSKNKVTPEGFVLGRRLFYDPVLSSDSSVSCGSCHNRISAFAHIDHSLSHGINGLIGKRNVPAIQNMIWNKDFMWDGGITHLDLQPIGPITNPIEMNETLENVVKKLQRDTAYSRLFKKAFNDSVVTSERMLKAITQFVAMMISSNSKYDKFTRGEEQLDEHEMAGLKLFRARCESCHKEPLFTDNTCRNNGLRPDSSLDDDGRKRITGIASDYFKFRVPSLRNVEMTYPYMHDGRFKNLQQVIDHYSAGNFQGENSDPLLAKTTNLSEQEKADIISFLKTLTDKVFLYDRRFADPFFQ